MATSVEDINGMKINQPSSEPTEKMKAVRNVAIALFGLVVIVFGLFGVTVPADLQNQLFVLGSALMAALPFVAGYMKTEKIKEPQQVTDPEVLKEIANGEEIL